MVLNICPRWQQLAHSRHSRSVRLQASNPQLFGRRGLFDHLVGADQNRWGDLKAERLGGLKVYDHLELGRKLNG